ncbi:MAG: glycosyl hydrolase 53 family protein [Bacteroidaceae bacterium]|nr:glycosyl hydrolase 53 family protein [Bacteroidaceae bacterium]
MTLKEISCTIVLALLASTIAFPQNKFTLGGDLSMLPQYESANTPYYNSKGRKIKDVLTFLRDDAKMNAVRVRLFVSPNPNEAQDGVVQDLEYVKTFGKRIKDAGLNLLLDIHYSDTWSDPGQQSVPATWYSGTLSRSNPANVVLVDSMYSYTKRCLEYLVENGATPDFVQIGNEISYGMLWRVEADRCYSSSANSTWLRFTNLLNSAAKAIREVTPAAKILLHIERSGDASMAKLFYQKMESNGVDYDMIGLSYYPFWHGYLPTLAATLNMLEETFPAKPVHIVETAYYYQNFPQKENSSIIYETTDTWPATVAGQQAFIEDLCTDLAKHKNVTGLYYWFPEENGNGEKAVVLRTWQNRGLWDNKSHKPNSGLMKLQNFLTEKEANEEPEEPQEKILGDLDDDGLLTVQDIALLIAAYLEQGE